MDDEQSLYHLLGLSDLVDDYGVFVGTPYPHEGEQQDG